MEFPIDAPAELIAVCANWHSGQWSSMYSVLSSSVIYSEEYLRGLASELRQCKRIVNNLPDAKIDDETAALIVEQCLWAENLENFLDNQENAS